MNMGQHSATQSTMCHRVSNDNAFDSSEHTTMSFDDSEAAWTAQLLTEQLMKHDGILDRPSGRDDLQVQKQQIDKNRNISFRGENVNDCKISILNQWSKVNAHYVMLTRTFLDFNTRSAQSLNFSCLLAGQWEMTVQDL